MLWAWLHQHRESGFSCALRLLVVVQSHLVLRLRFLLVWVVLLLLPLLCPARPAVSSVRRPPATAGVAVARPVMGPGERRRSVLGVGLLPLVLLPATGRGPIGHPRSLLRIPEPRPLLPELDMHMEVLLVILVPLRRGGRSPRPGPSGRTARSSAGAERFHSGGGRRSPAPSGVADDDRSSAFESVDFDRDDSLRSVLALIPELSQHGRASRSTISSVQDFSCIDLWFNSVLALKGRDLASSREITMLLCSFSRSVDPVELRPPAWDVALVLQSLTGAPYEPLRTCVERFLAQKTLFLLALASAKRIGELHVLSYRVSHSRNWGEVFLFFRPGLRGKDSGSLFPCSSV